MNPFPPPQPPPPPLPPPQSSTFPPSPQPPYYPHPTPTPTTPPAHDLPTALSSLTSLLHLCSITLHSLPTPFLSPSPTPPLTPCPFNPHHLLHPSSLFSHSLHCPPLTLPIPTLKYPHTLHSSNSHFSLHSLKSDLCFSLEPYLDIENNPNSFFYSNCPGVVSFPLQNANETTPPMLTLPVVLSSQCANFGKSLIFPGDETIWVVFLPSEVYAIRKETDRWNENDIPFMYSYRVLRAILGLGLSYVECLYTWVVDHSTRCNGILLDIAIRDHVIVLFKLCLKAIVSEAIDLASTFEGEESDFSDRSFKCPVLVEVLVWLATQLSVLYGELNGKLFAVNMLRKCICDCALSSCMFNEWKRGDDDLQELSGGGGRCKNRIEDEETNVLGETLCKSEIFVSQVAAAVAALHERSTLEEKLKALRNLPSLPAYQRSMEYTYISNKADEEREKRPNYRPLLEHDGLMWQRSQNNEDINRTKTTEELLAEERDYKRRRMSYRGKKLKRSTTQVMRDIIEEYMEDIRQASAIACPAKGAEAEVSLYTSQGTDSYYPDRAESGKRQLDSSALTKGKEGGYRKEFHAHGDIHSTDSRNDYYEKNMDRPSQWHHRHLGAEKSNGRSRQDGKDYSRNPNQQDSRAYSYETTISQEKRDYSKDSRDSFSRSSSRRYHKSHEKSSSHSERSDRYSDFKKRKARDAHDDFGDRYDPSKS